MAPDETARRAAERAARDSYGRLVAYLAYRWGDVAAAQDALADALASALEHWPRSGVPAVPEAWLMTAAKRNLQQAARHDRVRADPALAVLFEDDAMPEPRVFPDERLKLLFVCAHPAIDPGVRTPLMLQTVLGFDAVRIGAAFLVAPSAMAQRLVRAKAKIRDARIAFTVPEPRELPERLDAVLEAIYAAYGRGWDSPEGTDPRAGSLGEEAIYLARLVVHLLPEEPEARGLLALMLHCEARRGGRRTAQGEFVPLSEQDTARWDRPFFDQAEAELAVAARSRRLGRFQLEAAIQSAHAQRFAGGRTPWPAIAALYAALMQIAPSVGARVAQAAAVGEAQGADAGLALLDALAAGDVASYQPYWAVRAHLLRERGDADEARRAYDLAIGLAEDPAIKRFLLSRR